MSSDTVQIVGDFAASDDEYSAITLIGDDDDDVDHSSMADPVAMDANDLAPLNSIHPRLNHSFRGIINPRDPRLSFLHDTPPPPPSLRGAPASNLPFSSVKPAKHRGPKRGKTHTISKRSSSRLMSTDIGHSLICECCTNRCVWFFTANELLFARTHFTGLSHYEASKWILTYMNAFYCASDYTFKLKIMDFPVCLTAFLLFHGISRGKWYAVRSTFLRGGTDFLHGNICSNRPTPQTDIIVNWINCLVYCQGDPSPNSDEIYLPMSVVKAILYEAFLDDCKEDLQISTESCPSSYLFYKIFRERFAHVKWPKFTTLGKCDICTQIAVEMKHCTTQTKRLLRKRKKHHLLQNTRDRTSLSSRVALSMRDPRIHLTLDQDYANQLQLPHQSYVPKSWLTKCHRPRLQIGGMIDHGNSCRFLFLHFGWYKHDPNLSLTHLYLHLADLRSRGLPSSIFCLQADNCYKENKNKTTFAFLSMLVTVGWFTQIEMYFLSPGHTHGDVDRMFSRFGHLRKTINCDTPEDFITTWKKLAYRNIVKAPAIKFVRFVYDWKGYFRGNYHENIQGHSRPRAFLFKKNDINGIVQFWVKESALSPSWIGRTDDNLHGWEILYDVPSGPVGIFRPVPLKQELYCDVRKTFKWLAPAARIWWDLFFEDQFFWLPDEEQPPRGNVWDIPLPVDVAPAPEFVPAPVVLNIRIPDHPPSSIDELHNGDLIAVHPPNPGDIPSDDSDDETVDLDLEENMQDIEDGSQNGPRILNRNEEAHPYWIAKVIGFTQNRTTGVRKVKVRYYKRRGNTPQDRKYVLHDSFGTCKLGSILLYGFAFTTTGLLRTVTMRRLARLLDLQNP